MLVQAIRKAEAFQGTLPPMPIDPNWIVAGKPEARGTVLVQSEDCTLSTGLWECTAGDFRWTFGWDEFVYILEGEVTIRDPSGQAITLQRGDIAHFPLGMTTQWHVPKYVRKVFTLRTPQPWHLAPS